MTDTTSVQRVSEPCIAADLRHMTARWDDSDARVVLYALLASPLYPSLRAMMYVRASQWAWRRHLRVVAHFLKARAIRTAGVEVHPAAKIGPGFAFSHSVGIVIGHEVSAGKNLVVRHGVTLGHGGRLPGQPKIGDNVRIGAGAKVLGGVTIGDDALVGANAVVLADVADRQTVVGIWK
jgi:serine O-acetyltransferase